MENSIFASLDVTDIEEACGLTKTLAPHIGGVKIGLEYFNATGTAGYRAVADCGLPVFLDLKLHDIPNTVARTVRALAPLKPKILNLHASGGLAMMQAARQALNETDTPRPMLIGVTVLTSLDGEDLTAIGVQDTPHEQVLRLADLTAEAGLDGIVCAAHEIAALRTRMDKDFKLIVPGLRMDSDAATDQKRVMTPQAAQHLGADILVIGRPITSAANPAKAASEIYNSLALSSLRAAE